SSLKRITPDFREDANCPMASLVTLAFAETSLCASFEGLMAASLAASSNCNIESAKSFANDNREFCASLSEVVETAALHESNKCDIVFPSGLAALPSASVDSNLDELTISPIATAISFATCTNSS